MHLESLGFSCRNRGLTRSFWDVRLGVGADPKNAEKSQQNSVESVPEIQLKKALKYSAKQAKEAGADEVSRKGWQDLRSSSLR